MTRKEYSRRQGSTLVLLLAAFHRLIFNRIGRSRCNVEDTAAALKLAMVVYASTQIHIPAFPQSHPFAESYMNSWLLSNGHLRSGFSWTDNEHIVLPSVALMLDQTAGYLEETCKDLLVLNRQGPSVDWLHREGEGPSVELLHRTVFDFLSEKALYEALSQNAPSHISGRRLLPLRPRQAALYLSSTHRAQNSFFTDFGT